MASAASAKTGVVILNWNGWRHTVRCLESLCRLNGGNAWLVVCDNGSRDDSVQRIRSWAQGRGLGLHSLGRADVEDAAAVREGPGLVLIENGANLGFAGGNNVGIRFLLNQTDVDYVWILNNDSVADPGALEAAIERSAADPSIGITGSTIRYLDMPELVQAWGGGAARPSLAATREFCGAMGGACPPSAASVESRLDYVYGAAMLVTRPFLRDVGLMEERYFLYFEELDWALRGKKMGYRLGYAPRSTVFHVQGASTGADARFPARRSYLSDYYGVRGRILFTAKFYPYFLPLVYGVLAFAALRRVARRQPERLAMVLSLMFNPKRLLAE